MSRPSRIRHVLTALCVVGILLPATAGAATTDDPEEALGDVRQRLDDARQGLGDTERRRAVTLDDLEDAERRRAQLENELADLESELSGAEGDLATAENELGSTGDRIATTSERLDVTRSRLGANRDLFAERARQVYKHGAVDPASALTLDAGAATEVQRALGYMESVLAEDRRQVEEYDNLESRVVQEGEELVRLQERQEAAAEEAEDERDLISALVSDQRDVAVAADDEADRHASILVELEGDEQSSQQLIAALQTESEQLTAELRRRVAEAEQRRVANADAAAAARAQQPAVPAAPPGSGNTGPTVPAASGAPAAPASSGRFQLPAAGRLSSPFGYRVHPISGAGRLHAGQDIAAPSGSPIYAADTGVVASAGWRGGYGNAIVIDHGGGLATLYAHQSRLGVSAGQQVTRGQLIGYVGTTGYSTGPHLHFEVRENGTPVNPAAYL